MIPLELLGLQPYHPNYSGGINDFLSKREQNKREDQQFQQKMGMEQQQLEEQRRHSQAAEGLTGEEIRGKNQRADKSLALQSLKLDRKLSSEGTKRWYDLKVKAATARANGDDATASYLDSMADGIEPDAAPAGKGAAPAAEPATEPKPEMPAYAGGLTPSFGPLGMARTSALPPQAETPPAKDEGPGSLEIGPITMGSKPPEGRLPGFDTFDTSKVGASSMPSYGSLVKETLAAPAAPATPAAAPPSTPSSDLLANPPDYNQPAEKPAEAQLPPYVGKVRQVFQLRADTATSPEEKRAAEMGMEAASRAAEVLGSKRTLEAIQVGERAYQHELGRFKKVGPGGGGGGPGAEGEPTGKGADKASDYYLKVQKEEGSQQGSKDAVKMRGAAERGLDLLKQGERNGFYDKTALEEAVRQMVGGRVPNGQLDMMLRSEGITETFWNKFNMLFKNGEFDDKYVGDLRGMFEKLATASRTVLDRQMAGAEGHIRNYDKEHHFSEEATKRHLGMVRQGITGEREETPSAAPTPKDRGNLDKRANAILERLGGAK